MTEVTTKNTGTAIALSTGSNLTAMFSRPDQVDDVLSAALAAWDAAQPEEQEGRG